MLFNSLVFAVFLAVVWPLWRLSPPAARRWVLLVASLVFYGWWDWRFLALLVGSAAVDFLCARAIPGARPARVKLLVATSVVTNLGVLGFFKYWGFATTELGRLAAAIGVDLPPSTLAIVLPVGLSFYTFQSMAYTIDVARGGQPARSFREVLLYVAFFPQLVAGPIERSGHLLPQLVRAADPGPGALRIGAELFVWGLFKKVVVADNLAPVVQRAFDQPDPGGLAVLVGAYAFTLQIYGDFSGYSDMARGVARWFGVELMVNFRQPLLATGPRDLWRRWHISLSQWLRDYLYVPLGGSRGGRGRTDRNLLITMLLGGLWHGASWTFVVWGGVHGLALVLAHHLPLRLPRPVAWVLTLHLTVGTFVIFRVHELGQLGSLLAALAAGLRPDAAAVAGLRLLLVMALLTGAWDLLLQRRGGDLLLQELPPWARWAVIGLLLVAVALLGGSYGQPFLYFQF
ncbi:MBOAT family protein [Myxococcota bacterium]|nr:MBOAT family protein [Myxococcota bacterium]